jgi:hypothetical protein
MAQDRDNASQCITLKYYVLAEELGTLIFIIFLQ